MHDITLASSAPARSLASRLQLDLAERNDGGEQSHYGESFLLSNAFVWQFKISVSSADFYTTWNIFNVVTDHKQSQRSHFIASCIMYLQALRLQQAVIRRHLTPAPS